ncbi:sugar ABC transporter permease [Kineosporia sp. R_H_3]|uniref:sugar ABC transporter permease n=1 Tax=Kineosporia sp. R_H_3 TaxID=1961848 RepID=UPI000B4C105B|nr:ABC transporter permease [Kineosporia sp. R_H_3]
MTTSTATPAPEVIEEGGGIGGALRDYVARLRGGDTGSLPAVLGFIVLVIFFSATAEPFTSKLNWANLLNQSAAYIFIAMGLVFVLLLGEIDLSAGYTAGTSAAMMGVVMTQKGFAWPIAVLACLVTGAVIGLTIGILVARLGIPSFVVTLAYFLGLQGVLLLVIGEGGTIAIRDKTILAINNNNMSTWMGWVFFLVVAGGYAAVTFGQQARRRAAGLPTAATSVVLAKVGGLALLLAIVTFFLNQERSVNPVLNSLKGVPIIVPVTALFVVGLTFVLTRTSFGRHVYAVGGNAEAARRAGINVGNIKIACFVIGSVLAAIGGILIASRDNSVSPTSGGSSTLLLSVAAAVIGGTSLFGGKGRIIDAVIGGLVIGVIYNGLPFITQQAGIQFVVTAGVLLLAASVDAIARRRASATGR